MKKVTVTSIWILFSILYYLCGSYPRRSGLLGKSNHLRPIHLPYIHVLSDLTIIEYS